MGTLNKSALIVDDIEANISLMEAILELEDYSIKSATNGWEALRMLDEYTPDVILLDIMMDGMDGIEVLERIIADEKTRSIPVIMVSALHDEEYCSQSLSIGAIGYIRKPFNPITFLEEVKQLLGNELKKKELKRSI